MIAASTECVVVARSRAKKPAFAPLGVWLALLIAVFWFAAPASAQLDSGSISGTILDPTGKVVPAASVTIRGIDTGTVYSGVSSSTGSYGFPSGATGTVRPFSVCARIQSDSQPRRCCCRGHIDSRRRHAHSGLDE